VHLHRSDGESQLCSSCTPDQEGAEQACKVRLDCIATWFAGKEVLGRKLSVIKTSRKEAIWVKGEVKDFDEPAVRHKVSQYNSHQ